MLENIHKDYSDHVYISHPKHPTHILSHPRYVSDIVLERKSFTKLGGDNKISGLSRVLGQGILTNTDTEMWRRHRNIIQPYFSVNHLKDTLPDLLKLTDTWLETLESPTDLYPAMLKLSQQVMYQLIFESDVPDVALEIPLELATAKLSKQLEVRLTQRKILAQHLNNNITGICPHLREHGIDGEQRDDEVLTLIAAGHETSAAAMAWTLCLLCHNPEILARYQEAIRNVATDKLKETAYVRWVFAESLRLYPAIPLMPRVALEPVNIDGIILERGTRVMLNIWGIQQHAELWDNASDFVPERFAQKPSPFSYLPFGAGHRFCIGRNLALIMGEILLPYILQRYTPVTTHKRLPARRLAISLQPKGSNHYYFNRINCAPR